MSVKTIKEIAQELKNNNIEKDKIENYLEKNEFMYSSIQLDLIRKEYDKTKKRIILKY